MQNATNRPVDINVLMNRATIKGWELRQGIDQFAQTIVTHFKLRYVNVEWVNSVPTACINQYGDIKLHAVADDAVVTHATLIRYAGFVVHEALHWKYTNFNVRCQRTENRWYIDKLHNAIEDAYIERKGIQNNLLGNIKGLLTGLLDGMLAETPANIDWADPAQYPFSLAVYAREFCQRVPVPAELLPIYEEATRRIDSAQDSADTLAIAEWVYDQLNALSEDNSQNPGNPCEDGEPQPEGESGEPQPDGADEGEGEGEAEGGESGEGEGEGEGEGAGGASGADQDGASDPSDGPTGADQGEGEGEGATEGENAPDGPGQPDDAGKARKPSKGQDARPVEPTATDKKGSSTGGTYSSKSDIVPAERHLSNQKKFSTNHTVPGKLRYEIRRLFDNSSQTLFSNNRKHGSLDVRSLHKFGRSENLFQQRRDIEGIDSAVVLVVDVSGSMFPGVIDHAIKTCAALIDALSSAEVATAVVTFGDRASLIVPFGTRPQAAKKILQRIEMDGGTNDYVAVKYAHDLLRVRRESRKVCMVLTDGQGWVDATREQCRAGTALGITTIGIGIGHCPFIKKVYEHHVEVRSISDLASVSFSKIKAAV